MCVDCHFHPRRRLSHQYRVPVISTYKHIKCYNEHVHLTSKVGIVQLIHRLDFGKVTFINTSTSLVTCQNILKVSLKPTNFTIFVNCQALLVVLRAWQIK